MNVPKIRFKVFHDEWQSKKLKDITEINTGRSKLTNNNNGQYAILGSTGIIRYSNNFDYEGNFILIARVGAHVGNIYCFNGKVKISDNTIFIKSKNVEFLSNYLKRFDLKKLSFGTGQPLIKSSDLKKIKILLPSCFEQQQIGAFFSKLDALISAQSKKLTLLKQLKHGYLQRMFPQADQTIPRVRFKGFNDKWQSKKIENVVSITMGQSPSSENYTDNNNDYILIQGNADIKNHKIIPRVWTTQITKIASNNDIIMTVRAPVGEVSILNYPKAVIGRGVASLTIKSNNSLLFVYYLLMKLNISNYWHKCSAGSTFENINSNDIKNARLLFTSFEEQQQIGSLFAKLDYLIELQNHKLALLQQLKKGYLQKMFC